MGGTNTQRLFLIIAVALLLTAAMLVARFGKFRNPERGEISGDVGNRSLLTNAALSTNPAPPRAVKDDVSVRDVSVQPEPEPSREVAEYLRSTERQFPRLHQLKRLVRSDVPHLQRVFETNSFRNKIGAAWAIAYLAEPEVALGTLTNAFRGEQTLSANEFSAIGQLLEVIGYVGQRSDFAYAYLESMTRPAAWGYTTNWTYVDYQPTELRFAAFALMGLAVTGRPTVEEDINAFAVREEARIADSEGEVVTAAFYNWYTQNYGPEELIEQMLTGDATTMVTVFRLFKQTKKGTGWYAWKSRIRGLPPPGGIGVKP